MTQRTNNSPVPPESPTVHARVPAHVADRLREVARKERRSVSQVISLILESWAEDQTKAEAHAQVGKPKRKTVKKLRDEPVDREMARQLFSSLSDKK